MAVLTVKVSTTPQRILVANPKRVVYVLINTGANEAFIGHDKDVSTSGTKKGIPLGANGGVWADEYYKGEVWAIASGDTEICVVEVSEEEKKT